MEKRIVIKVYLEQFFKDYDVYYNSLNTVTKEVSHALFSNKCYTFEKAVEDSYIRSDLQDLVETAWRLSHDEDTVIAVLQKFNCEVI